MQNTLKTVATFLSYIIYKIFIIQNRNNKTVLHIIQQQIAKDDEILHYIRRKVVTQKEKILAVVLASLFID